ncbi:MAG: carboxymuconolactone decarboxylase family protein [Acidimicrobiia bacterium]
MARIPDGQVSDELPGSQHNNLHRALANNDEMNVAFGVLARAVHTASSVPHRTRELIVLRVSAITGSETEWGQHLPIAMGVGITLEQARAIRDGDFSMFTPEDRAVIEFGDAFDRLTVDDDIWDAAALFFSPQQMLELAMVAGVYGLACRICVGLGVDIDEGKTKIADS